MQRVDLGGDGAAGFGLGDADLRMRVKQDLLRRTSPVIPDLDRPEIERGGGGSPRLHLLQPPAIGAVEVSGGLAREADREGAFSRRVGWNPTLRLAEPRPTARYLTK